jgi:alpha-amylase/alpha-mannosidase (GH57 family)
MPNRSFCIHGHFYQPSREDPLTGLIPDESGSEPYANWNERVNDRCYKPNAEAGSFAKVSFNLGPTLVRWMEGYSQETIREIVASERSVYARNGVGNAMAQPYHHTILPLASRRDKVLQVRWGIEDFKHTFGHSPEGMWLPEAAANLETLSVLADEDIRFTILAPASAENDNIDTRQPYRASLPNGKSIVVFFYNSALSTAISFNPAATENAERFISDQLAGQFNDTENDQLVLVATDGELYGHHQPFREKFLAYLLDGALSRTEIHTSFPALWLKEHPVTQEVTIKDGTSWSCFHGVQRWADTCGCTPGGTWKKGLRDFLDQSAAVIDRVFEQTGGKWLKDPWKAREDIIHFVMGEEKFEDWEARNVKKGFSYADALPLRKLIQAQVERQRMFTSCGWFFEEFDRIEPRNNLKYAAQALILSEAVSNEPLINDLLPLLRVIPNPINNTSAGIFFASLAEQFCAKSREF